MNLQPSPRGKHSELSLENPEETHLFIDVGLGTLSIKGIRLARKAAEVEKQDAWPLESDISNSRLWRVADRMIEHAAILGARVGFDGLPAGLEDELALRNMASQIFDHLKTTFNDH